MAEAFFFPQTKPLLVKNFVAMKTNCFFCNISDHQQGSKTVQKKTDIFSLRAGDDSVQLFLTCSHCYVTLQYHLSCQHGGETGMRNLKCTTSRKSGTLKKPTQPEVYAQTQQQIQILYFPLDVEGKVFFCNGNKHC